MSRKPNIRYWASRGSWTDEAGAQHKGSYCTTLRGTQHTLAVGPDDQPLGPTYVRAFEAFRALFELEDVDKAGLKSPVRALLEAYLQALEGTVTPETLAIRRADLTSFAASGLVDQPAAQLTPYAVNRWLSRMRVPRKVQVKTRSGRLVTDLHAWGDGKVRMVVASLNAAFNWATRERLIPSSPIKGLALPPQRSRGREAVVTDAEQSRVLASAEGQLRELVACLHATGARPSELLQASASAWDDKLGCLVYYADCRRAPGEAGHKQSRKGKDRRIYFTGEALLIMRRRVAQFPVGPLFHLRGKPGQPLPVSLLQQNFRNLRRRAGVPHLTPYSYRHTYATRWLEQHKSIDHLAALLGNSAEVLRKHYAHLLENTGLLQALAAGFSPSEGSDTPPAVLPFGRAAV